MEFEILGLDGFDLMGREYALSASLERNMKLAQRHWRNFNNALRLNRVHLGQNWLKYAFIIEKGDKLLYYICVPKKSHVPKDFVLKTIPKGRYLMVKHTGSMNGLKVTVDSVYENLISENGICLKSDAFSYFERYDFRFHWNRQDSIIEIYFPIF